MIAATGEDLKNSSARGSERTKLKTSVLKGKNIFSKKSHDSLIEEVHPSEAQSMIKEKEEKFEASCLKLIRASEWLKLQDFATEQLDLTLGKSAKAFFYLGVSLMKM